MQTIDEKAKQIKLAIFDVDGTLTDGHLIYTDEMTQIKAFHAQDGLGLKLLQQSGVKLAIITTHNSPLLTHRFKLLKIDHLYLGHTNKIPPYLELLQKLNLSDEQVCYVGDDLPDLPLIRRAGLGVAVNNAVDFVKQHADWHTQANGGYGAVREICELIMRAQNTLDAIHQQFL